jgi:hypothetical protein
MEAGAGDREWIHGHKSQRWRRRRSRQSDTNGHCSAQREHDQKGSSSSHWTLSIVPAILSFAI